MSAELREFLLNETILDTWKPLSIKERVATIERTWDVKMSHDTLWKFYVENRVAYRTGKAVFRAAMAQYPVLQRKRKAFSNLLANLILQDWPLVWMDETSFTSQSYKAKSWSSRDKPPLFHQRNNKRHSVTVYGAFGNCLHHGVFELGFKTCGDEFR